MHALRARIQRLNNNSFKLYKTLQGSYSLNSFQLAFDRIQSDPFAPPSKITVTIPHDTAGFPKRLFATPAVSIAFRDALSRVLWKTIRKTIKGNRGAGNGGLISVESGGQAMLDRNTIVIDDRSIAVRFLFGLPARGRNIDSTQFEEMVFNELTAIVDESLTWARQDPKYYNGFVNLYEKQEFVRDSLAKRGLVAFIADGSVLPRKSGVEDTPLSGAIKFRSPQSMKYSIIMPDGETMSGMGVPEGVTLVTGGAFHGKTTLLDAIQNGIYNHIPGDGREYAISRRDVVKIRAEDGRRIAGANISLFVNDLPQGKPTDRFDTDTASGSTSQAANVAEALEAGCRAIVMDEDTSATNFLIRDARIRELIPRGKEPVTAFVDVAASLYRTAGVSTVIAVGGSGEYFDCANKVVMMDAYVAKDVTAKAKEIAQQIPSGRKPRNIAVNLPPSRVPDPLTVDASKGERETLIAFAENGIVFGRNRIDLSAWEQVLERAQYTSLGFALNYAKLAGYLDGKKTLAGILDLISADISSKGLDVLLKGSEDWEYLCEVRPLDIAAAINRLRSLRIV